ncbi:aminodeoxychorismate synthase component I [Aquimarina sp. ERC-38]|nr:aminodeoxychorismate synthase component I [Aquimarina sp. ERC-38]UZO80017.1 aminodeoxychorismate synthase component I [Aquimarina sp. ERC-38]
MGLFKKKLLQWSQQFEEVIWLDSNQYPQRYGSYEAIMATDAFTVLKTDAYQAFDKLNEYQQQTADWIFGYLSYDLKNDVENLTSKNPDYIGFPELYFFQPKRLFLIRKDKVEVLYLNMVSDEVEADWKEILQTRTKTSAVSKTSGNSNIRIKLRMSKNAYREKVKTILDHIHRGDIYEANFCQEFYAEHSEIDPIQSYFYLNNISQPPFATFLKLDQLYLLSASPERYIKKSGIQVTSQPIKGTAKRSKDLEKDRRLKMSLKNDAKEQSENIMIVDLVRNDLSKIANTGSVSVEELCGLYTFKQVHQMVSTVSAQVNADQLPVSILRATFPMGSMTGAPKIKAMQIIEAYEISKRGLYSGSVGYFDPKGNFDFNVVIRSILYNQKTKYISTMVGSAITAKSNSGKEYEECLLKAKAMREALEINSL